MSVPYHHNGRRALLSAAFVVAATIICSMTVATAFNVPTTTTTRTVPISKPTMTTSLSPTSSLSPLFANSDDNSSDNSSGGGLFAGVKAFFEELDAFVDDASARRLGNGAKFYGKRKSNFYGESDSMKKADRNKYDATEDYRVTSAGNYIWVEDENGVMRPATRRKKRIMERDP